MNIKRLMKDYSKSLKPTSAAEERVYLKVFGELPETKGINLFNIFSMKNNYLKFFAFVVVIGTFVLLPLGLNVNKDSVGKSPVGKSNTDNTYELGDSTDKTKELEDSYFPIEVGNGEVANNLEEYKQYIDSVSSKTDDSAGSNYAAPQVREQESLVLEGERVKVQDGYLSLECSNVQEIANEIKSITSTANGYVVSSSINGGENPNASIKIKVPADKFEEVMNKFRDLKVKVIDEETSITDKQNDLTAQIKKSESFDAEIKDLEAKIAAELDATKKANLEAQLNTAKYNLNVANNRIETIQKETDFSSIQIDLVKGNSDSIFSEFTEVLDLARIVIIFWLKVLIIAIVPAVIAYLSYRAYLKSRSIKFEVK